MFYKRGPVLRTVFNLKRMVRHTRSVTLQLNVSCCADMTLGATDSKVRQL